MLCGDQFFVKALCGNISLVEASVNHAPTLSAKGSPVARCRTRRTRPNWPVPTTRSGSRSPNAIPAGAAGVASCGADSGGGRSSDWLCMPAQQPSPDKLPDLSELSWRRLRWDEQSRPICATPASTALDPSSSREPKLAWCVSLRRVEYGTHGAVRRWATCSLPARSR